MRDTRGFTLPEMLATLSILGVLVAIAVIVILGILEQRRVDAATLQLASDMRLAHTRATNQLTDWRVIPVLYVYPDDSEPDYYIVRLERPHDNESSAPEVDRVEPRYFPNRIDMKNVQSDSGFITDDFSKKYWTSPWKSEPPAGAKTKTFEFNSDGTAKVYGGASGSICVTQDGEPQNRLSAISATARINTYPGDSCITKDD